jgi:hypothetical protein
MRMSEVHNLVISGIVGMALGSNKILLLQKETLEKPRTDLFCKLLR